CRGGIRRQMSNAVRTMRTVPILRVNSRRNRGTSRILLASPAVPRYHPPPPVHRDLPTEGGPMPVETPSVFANVIEEHLELKRRNAELESNMPLDRYESTDPFENHPLFKTEEQARIE